MAYEVMAGNTVDNTTLAGFLARIEVRYGKAERTWVMDLGTPRGRLSQLEAAFAGQPWETVRDRLQVKLLAQGEEFHVLVRSDSRTGKERAIRRQRLKKLRRRLGELRQQKLSRDQLLIKIGAARKDAGRTCAPGDIRLPKKGRAVTPGTFTCSLRKEKLRIVRQREGRYLLRSNLHDDDPARLWQLYIQLTEIEQAFKELKGDLAIRPIYHQIDHRIEAHILVAFIACCLQVTLKHRLRALAPGLTARAVLEKLAAIQMVDVHLPTTGGREIVLPRYTRLDRDQQIILQQLKLTLPEQPPPRLAINPQEPGYSDHAL